METINSSLFFFSLACHISKLENSFTISRSPLHNANILPLSIYLSVCLSLHLSLPALFYSYLVSISYVFLKGAIQIIRDTFWEERGQCYQISQGGEGQPKCHVTFEKKFDSILATFPVKKTLFQKI